MNLELPRWSGSTSRPRLQLPPGATDCHHHIYDTRFPAAPTGTLFHDDALVEDYSKLAAWLGIERQVVVQPSLYGEDNSLLLAALKVFGDAARGIAVISPDLSDADLRALQAGNVRGVRINTRLPSSVGLEALEALAVRVAPLGWHVQLVLNPDTLPELEPKLHALPCPVVIDHMAHLRGAAGRQHPAFDCVARLLQAGKTWLKLSGAYIGCESAGGTYPDAVLIGRAFADIAPERMLWGSDWPHPTAQTTKPDDTALLDLLCAFAPDAAVRTRILVENPASLYGF